MKKKSLRVFVVLALFAVLLSPISKMEIIASTNNNKAVEEVKKPGQVKNLKKVNVKTYSDKHGRNVSSAKIKFSKVNGATGYQVLVYLTSTSGDLTPLVFEYTTKKITYTVKNLVPDERYTIKVKAYKKGKDGKLVYGKTKSLKIKTSGKLRGCYHTCNACHACVPGNMLVKHIRDVNKLHKEIHAGYTIFWR